MRNVTQCLSLSLAALLAGMSVGCASFKEHSLTCNLWQEDPTGSNHDSAPGDKYIYGPFTRATLSPLAVVGDVTMLGVALGAGVVVGAFADACREGARSGGRVSY